MSLASLLSRKPVSVEIVPKPSTVIEVPDAQYMQLAEKLGICVINPAVTITLEDVLRDELIHIYPMAKVYAYMNRMPPKGMVWGWTCCRSIDWKNTKNIFDFGYNSQNGRFLEGIYNKPIPYPVLLTMEKIEDACKAPQITPAFFVSDYADRDPDPFLMVTTLARRNQNREPDGTLWHAKPEPSCFVVERWDEPRFRG